MSHKAVLLRFANVGVVFEKKQTYSPNGGETMAISPW